MTFDHKNMIFITFFIKNTSRGSKIWSLMVKNMFLPLKIGKKGVSGRVKSGPKPYFTPKLTQNRGPKR